MSAVVLAELQALADRAAAEEAEVIAELQPIADLGKAILTAYAARGVPPDKARRLMLVLVPLISAPG